MKIHSVLLLVLACMHISTTLQADEINIPLTYSKKPTDKQSSMLIAIKDISRNIGGNALLAGSFASSLIIPISAIYATSGAYIALRSPRFINPKDAVCAREAGKLGLKIFPASLAFCAACTYGSYKLLNNGPDIQASFTLSAFLQGLLFLSSAATHILR